MKVWRPALLGVLLALAGCGVARAADTAVPACSLGHVHRLVLLALARCCAQDLASRSGCRAYDAADRFAVIKDNSIVKPRAWLIVPTFPVTGIEDPQVLLPPVADYWADAWRLAPSYLHVAPDRTALAINSPAARTQDQLHIHISCVLPSVAAALAAHDGAIGSDPGTAIALRLPPLGFTYSVFKAQSLVGSASPFLLARAMPGVDGQLARQGIAVVGARTPGALYVLDTGIGGLNRGEAELLLDQFCR
jgi:CDP-diacylglycerol pyrophosphatase